MIVTKRTKIVGLSSIGALVFSVVLLSGMIYSISIAENNLILKQTEIAKVQMHEKELLSLARLVDGSKSEREQLYSYLLQEEDVIDFLSLIGLLAEEQNISLDISELSVTDLSSVFEELSMAININGEYVSVFHMLTILETLPYQSSIRSVNITGPKGPNSGGWTGEIVLVVTKQKEL